MNSAADHCRNNSNGQYGSIDPSAVIAPDATVEEGAVIGFGVRVDSGAVTAAGRAFLTRPMLALML